MFLSALTLGLLLGLLFAAYLTYAAPASLLLVSFDRLFPSAQAGAPTQLTVAHGVRLIRCSVAGLVVALAISTALRQGAGVSWISRGKPDLPANRPTRASLGDPLLAASPLPEPDRLGGFNAAWPDRAQLFTDYGWTCDVDVWRCRVTPLDCWIIAEDYPRSEGSALVQSDDCDPAFWVAPGPARVIEWVSTRTCNPMAVSQTDYVLLADGTLSVWQHSLDPRARDGHPVAALFGPWAGYLTGMVLASRADRAAHRARLTEAKREASRPTSPMDALQD